MAIFVGLFGLGLSDTCYDRRGDMNAQSHELHLRVS